MKKLLVFSLLTTLLLGGIFLTYAKDNTTTGDNQKTCDINGDGKISKADMDILSDFILNGNGDINKHDINNDGSISIADIMVCTSQVEEEIVEKTCDINSDGKISKADLDMLSDFILNGNGDINKHDINNDGSISIADIMVCTSQVEEEIVEKTCDINSDGKINKADMDMLSDFILNGNGDINKHDINNDGSISIADIMVCTSQVEEEIAEKTCDINNDGKVTITDQSRFNDNCNILKGRDFPKKCDRNGDGNVTITDINLFNETCFENNKEKNENNGNKVQNGILTNNLTKTVEYKSNIKKTYTVFDGSIKAINDDLSINEYTIDTMLMYVEGRDDSYFEQRCQKNKTNMTFNVYIDGELVGSSRYKDACNLGQGSGIGHIFENVNIKKGQTKSVKVELEVDGYVLEDDMYKFTLYFGDKKEDNLLFGKKSMSANIVPIKILKDNNEFTVQVPSKQNTVYLKAKNSTLAEFTIKPSEGNINYLNELEIEIDDSRIENNDIKLIIDGKEYNFITTKNGQAKNIICQPNLEISSKGVPVKVILKKELNYEDYKIQTNIKSINGKIINKTLSKRFVSALVYISKQENKGTYTKITLGVEKYDENYSISSVCMLTGSTGAGICLLGEKYADGPFEDGYTFTVSNSLTTQPINFNTYFLRDSERIGWSSSISIKKEEYPDYFKVNGEERKIYGYSSNSYDEEKINDIEKSYPTEMIDAYNFAYKNGITTVSLDKSQMYGPLTRIQMAKMLSNYAINVLGQEPDPSKGTKKFNDVTNEQNKKYDNAVTLSYQLGIMGQNMKNNNFRPNDKVTRAEFATALSRMLYNTEDGKGNTKYYKPHIEELNKRGIMKNTDNPNTIEKRGYVMTMLMRTKENKGRPCDMNDDGRIDETDIKILTNSILNGKVDNKHDVNGDGEVTITDVTICTEETQE